MLVRGICRADPLRVSTGEMMEPTEGRRITSDRVPLIWELDHHVAKLLRPGSHDRPVDSIASAII
jgi:hypothetical protein